MSIYKDVLGANFEQLHPMIQQRYDIQIDKPFRGEGQMREIRGGPRWLYPLFFFGTYWKLLFPEKGTNIPFTIENTARIGKAGEKEVYWERIFFFPKKKRYFNALMSLDLKRKVIQDYLGDPPLVYSDLVFTVTPRRGIRIESENQRLVLGKIEIPLPRLFRGLATVEEHYLDERQAFHIQVTVKNPLIGIVFTYEGEFWPK